MVGGIRQKFRLHFRGRVESWFRQYSIYSRLITVMLLVSIVPIMIIGGISINTIYQSMHANYVNHIQGTNSILADNLSLFIQDVESFGTQLLFSSMIRQGLQNAEEMTLNDQVDFIREVEQLISQNYSLLTMTSDISIYSESEQILYAQGYQYISEDFVEKSISELKTSHKSSIMKSFSTHGGQYLGIMMKITSGNPHLAMGYLLMTIDDYKMQSILKKGLLNGVDTVSLIELNGEIVTSIGEELKVNPLSFLEVTYLDGKHEGNIVFDDELINYHYVGYNDWYLISSTKSSYILNEVMLVIKSLILGIIILVVIVTAISFLLWQSIIGPMNHLIQAMKGITDIRLAKPQQIEGNDEMSYLYREFNVMIQFIKELFEDTARSHEEKRRLELKMLQAQINPHFLFNTLNSIKWMAEMSKVKPISEGIGALSRLLRGTISDTNEKITIREEIQNVEDYILIQRMRYGGSFTFELDLDETCLDYKITKFILQPIVENSLLHSLDEQSDLKVIIKVRSRLDFISVSVEDNGSGFDVDAVLSKKAKEKIDGKLSSIGMINVIERINLSYQQEGEIKILSHLNEGTVVIIKIPKQK